MGKLSFTDFSKVVIGTIVFTIVVVYLTALIMGYPI